METSFVSITRTLAFTDIGWNVQFYLAKKKNLKSRDPISGGLYCHLPVKLKLFSTHGLNCPRPKEWQIFLKSIINFYQCIGFEKIKSNQIKSKIFRDLIWIWKVFLTQWFDLDLPWFSLKIQNPNQTKSNKKKRSGNVLFVSLSSRKSEIPHKNSRLFGLILRNGLKYRCLSVSNRRQQWISSNRLTLRKIFLFP